jgi:hypothetical protein
MAVLGSLASSKKISGVAQVYLAAHPSGGYTGADDTAKMKTLKALFFSDSATDACKVVTASIYSDIDASGVDVKIKQAPIEYDPNAGSKYKAANGPSECTVTWSFKDLDANKLVDAFSAVAGDIITTTAGSGIAGRKTVYVGRQGTALEVAIMIRFPSEYAGEFRHIFIPYATMSPDWEIKLDKKSLAVVKCVATAICDWSLLGSNAIPPVALIDEVTAAAS